MQLKQLLGCDKYMQELNVRQLISKCRVRTALKWTHRSRQFFSEFKLRLFSSLQRIGAAPCFPRLSSGCSSSLPRFGCVDFSTAPLAAPCTGQERAARWESRCSRHAGTGSVCSRTPYLSTTTAPPPTPLA
jgi:hypothetical protein